MMRAAKAADGVSLIHVADRESDIYELLVRLTAKKQRFILRAAQDRGVIPLTGTSARGERLARSPEKEWNRHISGDPGEARFRWWLTSGAPGDLPSLCTSQPARSCSA
jgi:hypothetical protein